MNIYLVHKRKEINRQAQNRRSADNEFLYGKAGKDIHSFRRGVHADRIPPKAWQDNTLRRGRAYCPWDGVIKFHGGGGRPYRRGVHLRAGQRERAAGGLPLQGPLAEGDEDGQPHCKAGGVHRGLQLRPTDRQRQPRGQLPGGHNKVLLDSQERGHQL